MATDSVKDVSDVVQALMTNVVSELTSHDRAREEAERGAEPPEPEPRLFFPEGVELIDVTVNIAGINVHVEVAGPKGTGGKSPLELKPQIDHHFDLNNSFVCDHDVTVADDGVGNPGFQIIWHNREPQDLTVAFDTTDGCPLDNSSGDCNGFTVAGNGGQYPTTVDSKAKKQTYRYNVYDATKAVGLSRGSIHSGNSKVVIQ